MSFIRPEARATLWRWREALAGLVALALGLWLATAFFGLLFLLGCVLLAIGLALVFVGIRRARFHGAGGGAGIVEVDERLITYFGPTEGGSLSLDDLARVRIQTRSGGPKPDGRFWHLEDTDGTALVIPGEAENAEALFDALSPLSGFDWTAMQQANRSTRDAWFVVWQRPVRQQS